MMELGPEVIADDQPLSVDHLLPLTSPQVPTLCILPPTSTQTENYQPKDGPRPLDLFETAARELNRRLCSFGLFDKEHWDEFLLELPQLASGNNWLIVEHCHLYIKWRECLEDAVQVHWNVYYFDWQWVKMLVAWFVLVFAHVEITPMYCELVITFVLYSNRQACIIESYS